MLIPPNYAKASMGRQGERFSNLFLKIKGQEAAERF
jgi:hypothetical protein